MRENETEKKLARNLESQSDELKTSFEPISDRAYGLEPSEAECAFIRYAPTTDGIRIFYGVLTFGCALRGKATFGSI